jgi:hypothetical protein
MQNTTSKEPRRRPAYGVLIGIILLTIPCYLIGFAALFILQRPNPIAPAATATIAPTATSPIAATATLGSLLPTQPVPPTATQQQPQLPTTTPATAGLPTATFTAVPILTPTPLPSPSPTLTEVPTIVVTNVPTPIP